MRTLLFGDIVCAARALAAVSADCRAGLLETLLQQANAAHHYHKRLLKPHPCWGNGSLMARANAEPQVAEAFWSNLDHLGALQMVIAAIMARTADVRL